MTKFLKLFFTAVSISLLAAGCSPLATNVPKGVLRTTDSGANWQWANIIAGGKSAINQETISVLKFEPGSRDTILAGSYTGGIYRSNNNASTWVNILANLQVYDFAFSPAATGTIYAAGLQGSKGKVLVTTNGGASWQDTYTEGSDGNTVRAIAVDPNNAKRILIGTLTGDIHESLDGGKSWSLKLASADKVNRIRFQNNSLYAFLSTKGPLKSTDNGKTFLPLASTLTDDSGFLSTLKIPGLSKQKVSTFSQVSVSETNANLIYVATDAGLFRTNDEGKNWERIDLPVQNQEVVIRGVYQNPWNQNQISVAVEGTQYDSQNGGSSWQTQNIKTTGYINAMLFDPTELRIAYAGIYAK